MAKPNYQFEKRQKELAKKNKKEEKRRQKLKDNTGADDAGQEVSEAVISGDDLPGTEKN